MQLLSQEESDDEIELFFKEFQTFHISIENQFISMTKM